jgi:hypothetical protein
MAFDLVRLAKMATLERIAVTSTVWSLGSVPLAVPIRTRNCNPL